MNPLLLAGGLMAILGVSLSVVLAIANKKLYVFEDPRIDAIDNLLAHANCGACGVPGCRAFAEKLVAGEANPAACTATAPEAIAEIAALLGVEAGEQEKRVARVACAGGNHVAHTRALYQGIETCRAAGLIAGGGKGCTWGCLGFGDCAAACPFDAIRINKNDLPVIDENRCTACGECVAACPKNLISVHPVEHRLWVACKTHLSAKAAKNECAVACFGCGLCAKDAPEGLIELRDSLPVIDYSKNELATPDVIQRCTTGAIVWLDPEKGAVRGEKAKPVENTEPLPVG